ncbi:MAG: right-handed parallel beta-helix repeat-containing protein [Deltaproteobacteria bacterium]|nr:right-handed parallel beta-helix repeat-containing protein [Deltaproteobacteria bacterium]
MHARAAVVLWAAVLLAGCTSATVIPPDGGSQDAGQQPADGGNVDAGPGDAGSVDAGPGDAGSVDAGPSDAGQGTDAGPTDAGNVDAGFDAGAMDAGPAGPCTPDATLPCTCSAGTGTLRCLPDGTSWGACSCESYAVEIAVSPNGHDTGTGTLADPFQTLARAEAAVQAVVDGGAIDGGVVVWVRGGDYELSASLTLGASGSGSDAGWVTWRGYPGEVATLIGGHALDPAAFSTVTSASPIWNRLDPSAQGQVQVVDLTSQGVTDYGTLQERGFCSSGHHAALELFFDGAAMPLARWPEADTNTAIIPDTSATALDLFGTGVSPDVTGHYVQNGTQDGVSSFARNGLVNGLQYNLYRYTWVYQGTQYTAWFLTTGASGYPSNTDPWWYAYTPGFADLSPNNGAAGNPSFKDPAAIDHGFAQVGAALSTSQFGYIGTRPSRWSQASEVWIHGMLKFDWADCHQQVSSIDTNAGTITLAQAATYGIAANQPWYAENLVEEITEPGEWWLDRSNGQLYFWPPTALAGHHIVVSTLDGPLVTLQQAKNVTLEDLSFLAGRSNLVSVSSSADIRLRNLTLQGAGTDAVAVSGTDVGVELAHIFGSGNGGVRITGGDRPSLTPGNDYVENSHIHDFGRWETTYRPGVSLDGVANRASHNLIHASPHAAILYGGNEHVIELNDIHDVCRIAADSGAIYAGRDWGARGNIIRNNFIHQVQSVLSTDVNGVYLDDCLSGITVEGNIFDDIAGDSILHGGGRDDVMRNNVFAHYNKAIAADSRCIDWLSNGTPNHTPGDSWDLLGKLEAMNYQQPPWSTAYPACAAIPDDWNTLIAPDAGWLAPQGSVFSENVGDGSGTFISAYGTDVLPAYAEIANNLPDAGALFVDPDAGNFNLNPSSGAFGLPGFTDIPFDSIGIHP